MDEPGRQALTVTDAMYVQTSIEPGFAQSAQRGRLGLWTFLHARASSSAAARVCTMPHHYQRLATGGGSEREGPFCAGR